MHEETRARVELMKPQEVANRLGVSIRSSWRMVRSGQLVQPIRFNRKLVRFRAGGVDDWLATLPGLDRRAAP